MSKIKIQHTIIGNKNCNFVLLTTDWFIGNIKIMNISEVITIVMKTQINKINNCIHLY